MNLFMDYAIKSNKVQVVNGDGHVEIMSRDDAIALAKSQGMNLVQVSFNKNVYPGSICKILDYAKFKYDQKKKQKEQAKKARESRQNLKEVCFTIRIDDGDKTTKLRHIAEFINDGDKVKVSVILAKRELDKKEFAKILLNDIVNETNDIAEIDSTMSFEGRCMSCILRKRR